jgi:hypothetical protein
MVSAAVRALLIAVLLLVAAAPARAAIPQSGELVFDIVREGSKIGTHRFRFTRSGERVDVAIDIQIQVKVLLLTVFAYQHSNRETWEDGRLVKLATRTNDDGEEMQVVGVMTPAGFKVSGKAGEEMLTPPVMPTSYWRTGTVEARQMLNTQTGEVMNVTVTPGPETRIRARGRMIDARHYVISGDLRLELWYDRDDILVGLRFKASDGSTIHYSLRPASETTARGG